MSSKEPASPRLESQPADAFGTIEALDCRGRRVFLRLDPYVVEDLAPRTASSSTPEAAREESSADNASASKAAPRTIGEITTSLERLLQLEARVVIGTHVSREVAEETGLADLEAVATRLSERLGVEVLMPDQCVGDAVVRVIHNLRKGQLCVLPDLLEAPGEAQNDEGFARGLAGLVDAYVGDAFSASHLEYASLVRLPRLAPRRALGYRARRELGVLSRMTALPRGTLGLALGAERLEAEIELIEALLPRLELMCVSGGLALTLLAALGKVQADACPEPERLARARSLLTKARDMRVSVVLPSDFRVQFAGDAGALVVGPDRLVPGARLLDVGPESIDRFAAALGRADNLLWWGALGNTRHAEGRASSQRMAELCSNPDAFSVVVGGEVRRFLEQQPSELRGNIDLISTGAAAARMLVLGRRLPGIEALRVRS